MTRIMLAWLVLFSLCRSALASISAVSTLAGTSGTSGYHDAEGTNAKFNAPRGVAAAADGTTLYVTDAGNNVIRKIASGTVTTIAGTAGTSGSADGAGASATFDDVTGVAVSPDGATLYVTDLSNDILRKVTLSATNTVSTWVGQATVSGGTDGVGVNARVANPAGLALSSDGLQLFLAEYSDRVRQIATATATVSTLAGTNPPTSGAADGVGAAATFNSPFGVALSPDGTTVYVADGDNHLIRKIVVATKTVTTLAGTAGSSGSTDAIGAAARFDTPRDVVVSLDGGTLYVADRNNHAIRAINLATKAVTTFAGKAGTPGTLDGLGAAARFNTPVGLAISPDGTTLYVVDNQNHAIRAVVIAMSSPSAPPPVDPPPPPPTPPSPGVPLPPGAPGEALSNVLTMNATLAGTVTAFDATGYKNKLASFIGGGVSPSDITLTVVAASIVVSSEIFFASAATAEAAQKKLGAATTVELTTALGVTVESKDAPVLVQQMIAARPKETPRLPTSALVIIIVVVIFAAVGVIIFAVLYKKKLRSAAVKQASSGA